MLRQILTVLALVQACDAFMLQPAARSPVAASLMSPASVALPGRAAIEMAAKKPVKKLVKKPVKKPVKKAVKKPVKKAVKKPVTRGVAGRTAREELGFIGSFGVNAVQDYGGGNGKVLFSPTFIAAAAAWVFVLARFVLFYGAFGDN